MSNTPEGLKILSAINNEDGTTTLEFEIDNSFKDWFLKEKGIESFCHIEFQKFIKDQLSNDKKNIIEK